MTSPFDPLPEPVAVTVITHGEVAAHLAARVLHLEPAMHDHVLGNECVACAARSDIRAMLFDLLQQSRTDQRPLISVLIDASALSDPRLIIDKLTPGKLPALGLRDHTVAKSFHLARID